MNTKSQIKKFEKNLDIIKSITRAFEHTATQRMGVNKAEIASLDKHLTEAKQTYVDVKISIAKSPNQKQTLLRLPVRGAHMHKIVILISSEPSYYGNLLGYMTDAFSRELALGGDAVVVGKPGKEEFDKINKQKYKYSFFDFNDDKPDWRVVNKIAKIASNYLQINVIFTKFQSILNQDVKNVDIAGEVINAKPTEAKKYLIKPDNKTALTFLENQIITSQILQKLYENGLAKGAIRVRILEIGEIAERLTEAISRFEIFKKKIIRDINNRKLAGLYSSSSIWQAESIFTVYR